MSDSSGYRPPLGVGGIITAAPDLVALLWIQSRMVFYIAAAYGYDPSHPMRPAVAAWMLGCGLTVPVTRSGRRELRA